MSSEDFIAHACSYMEGSHILVAKQHIFWGSSLVKHTGVTHIHPAVAPILLTLPVAGLFREAFGEAGCIPGPQVGWGGPVTRVAPFGEVGINK